MAVKNGVRVEEGYLFVYGAVVYDNVVEVTRAGVEAIKADNGIIDLAKITQVDSSAVSMLLEWVRTAEAHQKKIELINLPENLVNLIELYGVSNLISFGCTVNMTN